MTPEQITAWLGGFIDAVGDQPTAEQWAALKAKLAETKTLAKLTFPPGVRQDIGWGSVSPGEVFSRQANAQSQVYANGHPAGPSD